MVDGHDSKDNTSSHFKYSRIKFSLLKWKVIILNYSTDFESKSKNECIKVYDIITLVKYYQCRSKFLNQYFMMKFDKW